jgi:hypothetical protein
MIKTRHTDEEKNKCVNEYLNGKDKYYLSGKYSASIRTIDRWIKEINVDEVKLNIAKRVDTIPIDIQEEILKTLNANPIFQGFNIAEWNAPKVIKYINNIYGIEINRRMAKALIADAKKVNTIKYEDRVYSEIEELEAIGYSIVLLDYIKIGRINSIEVEPLELRKYTENKLDVNLVIARANEHIYLDIVVSEINIVDKTKTKVTKVSEKEQVDKQELQRKVIVDDKYEVLNKIKKAEGKEQIIFITTYDKDIDKLIRKRSNIKYFIVNNDIYDELLQEKYEGAYGESIVYCMRDNGNSNRAYRSIADISKVVMGKVDSYVLKVTSDKISIEKSIKYIDEKDSSFQIIKQNEEKRFKMMNLNFIYNI